MSVLCDRQIQKLVSDEKLIEWTTQAELETITGRINPNSIDLTIALPYYKPVPQLIPLDYGKGTPEQYWKRMNYGITLEPGDVILAGTTEYIRMPAGYCGQIFTKSSLGRMFINHMMAGVIDSGFEGCITLELKNEGKHTVYIPIGARVVQMVVYKMDGVPKVPYNRKADSRYCFAEGIEFSKAEK